jgi:hypothetical protein
LLAGGLAVVVLGLARSSRLPTGLPLQIGWLLPFFLCWGLGEGLGLFQRISWWDHPVHLAGGAAIYALFEAWFAPRLRLPLALRMAVGILVALGVGAGWEIGEFASDRILGSFTQSGLDDTMFDLIFDLLGGGLAALGLALCAWRSHVIRVGLRPQRA